MLKGIVELSGQLKIQRKGLVEINLKGSSPYKHPPNKQEKS